MLSFEKSVQAELKRRGMSQRSLAKELNISAPYLNDILNNRRHAPDQKKRIKYYLFKKDCEVLTHERKD